jgi:hypothetical protein
LGPGDACLDLPEERGYRGPLCSGLLVTNGNDVHEYPTTHSAFREE